MVPERADSGDKAGAEGSEAASAGRGAGDQRIGGASEWLARHCTGAHTRVCNVGVGGGKRNGIIVQHGLVLDRRAVLMME